MALQVEKTSKRGGRIIHEKDMMPPPLVINTPPRPGQSTSPGLQSDKPEPTITEIMKSPSKVVLLRVSTFCSNAVKYNTFIYFEYKKLLSR